MIPAPPLTNMRCRRYRPSDRSAALGIFDSNTDSLLESERAQFLAFVDGNQGPYLVVEDHAGTIIGCGGVARTGSSVALCWGIVGRRYHRRGVGRLLLRIRLGMAAGMPGVTEVMMNTSNETAPFFEREGFETLQVTQDFFRPGLHKHEMVCELDAPRRADIQSRLGELLRQGHRLEAGLLR